MINGNNISNLYENLLDNFEVDDLDQYVDEEIDNRGKDNLLKRKRKRKNKKSKKGKISNTLENRCKVQELLNETKTGNIIVKEISTYFNYKLFITRNKEVVFRTDESVFRKGRDKTRKNGIPDDNSIPSSNFWAQRYYYFSKFDEGIKLDYESWYSVTPEEISVYIAKSLQDSVVVDAFCGSGGNTIQFSKFCKKVYSVDIDQCKIDLCRNNTQVYQCEDNIEFITCDYLQVKHALNNLPSNDIDYVFLSPPWGGINYKSTEDYSLKQWITPDIHEIIRVSLDLSQNLVFYLPRNTQIEELFSIISEIITERRGRRGKSLERIGSELEEGEAEGEGDELSFEEEDDDPTLFAEVQMLKSAEKIKAILVYFGSKYNTVSVKDIRKYLLSVYENIESYQLCQLVNLAKIMGVSKFFYTEYNFRKTNLVNVRKLSKKVYSLLKHIKDEVLREEELKEFIKLDKKQGEDSKIRDHKNMVDISKLLSEQEYKSLNSI